MPELMRHAHPDDAEAIAAIYNQGIEERRATFETESRQPHEVTDWIAGTEKLPLLVAEDGGRMLGWAHVSPYSDRCAYEGVGECTVYVDRTARGQGVGSRLLDALASEAEQRGYWKLIGRLFTDNSASLRLVRRCGFREVGLHRRHGRLDGEWRDVLVVERLLGEAANPA